jgi:hypothetical protein
MTTTTQLKKNLDKIQVKAVEKLKSFFDGKPYDRIIIEPRVRNLPHANPTGRTLPMVRSGLGFLHVREILRDGSVIGDEGKQSIIYKPTGLPVETLLEIIQELDLMKKHNLLKKP